MTKKTISLLCLIAALLLPTVMTSCSDDDNSGAIPANAIYEIVTFDAVTSAGSTFTLLRPNGNPPLTLVASNQFINTEIFKTGERIMLVYVPENGNSQTGGNIRVYAGGLVTNGDAEVKDAQDTDNFFSQPVQLSSAYLTGNYLNFDLKLDCTLKPKVFTLYIDQATLGTDMPEAYLIVKADDLGTAYWQQHFASFKVDALIESGADQFRLTVRDERKPDGFFTATYQIYR